MQLSSAVLDRPLPGDRAPDTFVSNRYGRRFEPQSITPYSPAAIVVGDPISVRDRLLSRLSAAQRELAIVSMHLTPAFREQTMLQLRNLFDPESWDDEDELPDAASLRSFARAMAVLRPRNRPMLGLSERGHLLAMWGTPSKRLSLEHLAYDQLKWFVSNHEGAQPDLAAGRTDVARISRIVEAHDLSQLLHSDG